MGLNYVCVINTRWYDNLTVKLLIEGINESFPFEQYSQYELRGRLNYKTTHTQDSISRMLNEYLLPSATFFYRIYHECVQLSVENYIDNVFVEIVEIEAKRNITALALSENTELSIVGRLLRPLDTELELSFDDILTKMDLALPYASHCYSSSITEVCYHSSTGGGNTDIITFAKLLAVHGISIRDFYDILVRFDLLYSFCNQ